MYQDCLLLHRHPYLRVKLCLLPGQGTFLASCLEKELVLVSALLQCRGLDFIDLDYTPLRFTMSHILRFCVYNKMIFLVTTLINIDVRVSHQISISKEISFLFWSQGL